MAASSILIALSLIILIGSISGTPQDEGDVVVEEGGPCVTGKNIAGNCVIRNHCEFNTPAIDLTLYAPKGYKSTCPVKWVCCPERYQVKTNTQPAAAQGQPEDFSFEDDD